MSCNNKLIISWVKKWLLCALHDDASDTYVMFNFFGYTRLTQATHHRMRISSRIYVVAFPTKQVPMQESIRFIPLRRPAGPVWRVHGPHSCCNVLFPVAYAQTRLRLNREERVMKTSLLTERGRI